VVSYLLLALLAGVAALAGGLLYLFTRLRALSMRYAIAFAAGLLLSTVFFEMLPELTFESPEPSLLALGFFSFYAVEKLMIIHTCGEAECEGHTFGKLGMVGLTVDGIVDGAAIASGFLVEPILGVTIAIAVAAHELPQGFATGVIMQNARYSSRIILSVLIAAAVIIPLGALLAGLVPKTFFSYILAFVAGNFLYIAGADLLPEAHKLFNWKVVATVMLGAALIPLSGLLGL
jgi:zinc and cadmium transporter